MASSVQERDLRLVHSGIAKPQKAYLGSTPIKWLFLSGVPGE
jgi:hypothetical protein